MVCQAASGRFLNGTVVLLSRAATSLPFLAGVVEAVCRADPLNLRVLVPLADSFWCPYELVECHQKGGNAQDAPKLMAKLSPQLCHPSWLDVSQLHHLEEQSHCLVKPFLRD